MRGQRGRSRLPSMLVALIAVAAFIVSGVQGAGATAQLPLIGGVTSGPTFNNPASLFNPGKDKIKTHLLDLIRGVPAKSYIRVALYGLNDANLANALVTARKNGVVVRAILDSRNANKQSYQIMRSGLGTNTRSGSWVKLCPRGEGCLAGGINHNKFWLFSKTKGAYRVVVQSSSNMGESSYRKQWNTAHTLVASDGPPRANAPKNVYDAFRTYFEGMTVGSFARFKQSEAFGTDRTYFFPKLSKASGDNIAAILDKVTCVDQTTGKRSVIRIAMFKWTRASLASKAMQKTKQGCDIHITYTSLSSKPWSVLHPRSGPKPALFCYVDVGSNGRPAVYVHAKYMLIDGIFYGKARRMVVTGSPNNTHAALWSNDEAILRTDEGYLGYLANFNLMTAHASPGRNERKDICQGQLFS